MKEYDQKKMKTVGDNVQEDTMRIHSNEPVTKQAQINTMTTNVEETS